MKPFSKKTSRSSARNAALMNLLATPGLGSLMAGRWLEGAGQLILSVGGFALVVIWFIREMVPYYSEMFSDAPPKTVGFGMLVVGAILFALAWVWSLFTSLSLAREVSKMDVTELKSFAAGQMKSTGPQIAAALNSIPGWQRRDETITRTFQFKNFPAALKFVNAVGEIAEQVQHHPDIDIRWNKVTLVLTTHDAGGLTEKDFALARQCDALALMN